MGAGFWLMVASIPVNLSSMFMGTNFAVRIPTLVVGLTLYFAGLILVFA